MTPRPRPPTKEELREIREGVQNEIAFLDTVQHGQGKVVEISLYAGLYNLWAFTRPMMELFSQGDLHWSKGFAMGLHLGLVLWVFWMMRSDVRELKRTRDKMAEGHQVLDALTQMARAPIDHTDPRARKH